MTQVSLSISIETKLKKLNKNYTCFDKNVLCCTPVFAALFSEEDYVHFAGRLNGIIDGHSLLFDEIIIITPDTVIKYSLCEKHYVFDRAVDLSSESSQAIQKRC